jgi:hypothetical protein
MKKVAITEEQIDSLTNKLHEFALSKDEVLEYLRNGALVLSQFELPRGGVATY